MNIILVPFGSSGDIPPFIGIGRALQKRGHQVTVIVHTHFEPLVRRVGLACCAVGEAEQYDSAASNPDLWHPRKGLHVVARLGEEMIRPTYDLVSDLCVADQTVVVAAGLAFGARIAVEKHRLRLATVHLQPSCFRSVFDANGFRPTRQCSSRSTLGCRRKYQTPIVSWAKRSPSIGITTHFERTGLPGSIGGKENSRRPPT